MALVSSFDEKKVKVCARICC